MRRLRVLTPEVNAGLSRLVFLLALPCLIISKISQIDFSVIVNWRIIGTINVILLVFVLVLYGLLRAARVSENFPVNESLHALCAQNETDLPSGASAATVPSGKVKVRRPTEKSVLPKK